MNEWQIGAGCGLRAAKVSLCCGRKCPGSGPGKLTIKLQIALSCSLFIYLYHFVHFLRVGRNETSIQLGGPKLLSSLPLPLSLSVCQAVCMCVCVCAIGVVWVCDCLSFWPVILGLCFQLNFHTIFMTWWTTYDSTRPGLHTVVYVCVRVCVCQSIYLITNAPQSGREWQLWLA